MAKKRKRGRPTYIRAWRKFKGLSQDQLAYRVGLAQATIARIERGDIAYTQPVLEAIAEALGTDPASLLMRDPTDPEAIWSLWDSASPGEKRQILEVAKALRRAS